jgi:hypothetical protein
MAIPSGAGTEVLRRKTLHNNNATTTEILSGESSHIYTILSIVFCSITNGYGTIDIKVNDGSNDIFIVRAQEHTGYETFVWNDKIILFEDDDLDVYNSVADGDWYLTYIDQHF